MLTGSCLCGAIAYEADAELARIIHCHCQTCRKTHGSAFSSVTAVPREVVPLDARQRAAGRLRILARQVPPLLHALRLAPDGRAGGAARRAAAAGLPRHAGHRPAAGPYLAIRRRVLVRPQGAVPRAAARACHEPDRIGGLPLRSTRTSVAAQELAGQRAGRAAIRPFMPEQHRAFFPLLPYLFTATLDADGAPVASMLWGPAGFVHSPDPVTLRIDALPSAAIRPPAASRPASRSACSASTSPRGGATAPTAASQRSTTASPSRSSRASATARSTSRRGRRRRTRERRTPREALSALDDAARRRDRDGRHLLRRQPLARRHRRDGGLDISHRGGRPGFVAVRGDTLVVPDFRGNRFFNTLGNLLGDPRAGLLFIDFATGDLLQLQGTATIDWTAPDGPRARSGWRSVERGWRRRGRAALRLDVRRLRADHAGDRRWRG